MQLQDSKKWCLTHNICWTWLLLQELAMTAGIARPDAVRYAEKLQDGDYKEAVEDAKRWLKSTIKKIVEIELNGHEFMKYCLG